MAENFPILAKGKGGTKYKVQQAQNAQSLPIVQIVCEEPHHHHLLLLSAKLYLLLNSFCK